MDNLNNIVAESVISATVRFSNKEDNDRKYDINVEAIIVNGKIINFQNGIVCRKPDIENSEADTLIQHVAEFHEYGESNFGVNFYELTSSDSRWTVMSEIELFIKAVRNMALECVINLKS